MYVNTNGGKNILSMDIPKGDKILAGLQKMFSLPLTVNVEETDIEEWVEGDRDWEFEVDANYLKNFLKNIFLGYDTKLESYVNRTFDDAIRDRKVKILYRAFLIIATKR